MRPTIAAMVRIIAKFSPISELGTRGVRGSIGVAPAGVTGVGSLASGLGMDGAFDGVWFKACDGVAAGHPGVVRAPIEGFRAGVGMGESANWDVEEFGQCHRLVPPGVESADFPQVNVGFRCVAGSVDGRPEQLGLVEQSADVDRDELSRTPQFLLGLIGLGKWVRSEQGNLLDNDVDAVQLRIGNWLGNSRLLSSKQITHIAPETR